MSQNLWRLPTVQTRGRWWMLYRLAPFAAFLTLIVVLFYLVWQPFFHPRLYLLFATAEYPLALLPPHSEPGEDLAAIRVSQAALVDATEGGEGAGGIASPAALDAIFDHLDDQEIRRRDVLVAWIRARSFPSAASRPALRELRPHGRPLGLLSPCQAAGTGPGLSVANQGHRAR